MNPLRCITPWSNKASASSAPAVRHRKDGSGVGLNGSLLSPKKARVGAAAGPGAGRDVPPAGPGLDASLMVIRVIAVRGCSVETDAGLLHLVEQCSVAYVEPLRRTQTIPARALQHLENGRPLCVVGRAPPDVLQRYRWLRLVRRRRNLGIGLPRGRWEGWERTLEKVRVIEHDHSFDDVFEFAHVTGITVIHEAPE